jgi:hypothetical protein
MRLQYKKVWLYEPMESKLQNENHPISYETYMNDFKNALSIFPFFVCVWFNIEPHDKILEPIFPIKFLKILMKYYVHYL